jgi:hypothetical protein
MLVLKVPRGLFKKDEIKTRFAGCTVSFKNEGNNTLVMVEGLKVRLNVDAEIYFVETCRISSSPQHQGPVHGHREQPAPMHHGHREQPDQTHHGQHRQHNGGHVQHGHHREGHVQSAKHQEYVGPEEFVHKGKSSVQTPRQGTMFTQGAWGHKGSHFRN